MKTIQEDIIKTQDELIEILKSQLQNSNDIIEEQKKLMNMHEEVIKKQSTLLNNFKKIVYEQQYDQSNDILSGNNNVTNKYNLVNKR